MPGAQERFKSTTLFYHNITRYMSSEATKRSMELERSRTLPRSSMKWMRPC